MTTRCKALCMSVKKVSTQGYYTDPRVDFMWEAEFCAVTSGSPENKAFFSSTPTLTLSFKAINGDRFEAGKEYYLDLTKAELAT